MDFRYINNEMIYVMNSRGFITNRIILPLKSLGNFHPPIEPKKLSSIVVILMSLLGTLSLIVSYIPNRIGIGSLSSSSDSLQIVQPKMQVSSSSQTGIFGHGIPGLYHVSILDLLMAIGITTFGCIFAYVMVSMWLKRSKEKEEKMLLQHR